MGCNQGVLADRTKSKHGRFRACLLFMPIPEAVRMLGCIPIFFYNLTEEKHAQIVKELEERSSK